MISILSVGQYNGSSCRSSVTLYQSLCKSISGSRSESYSKSKLLFRCRSYSQSQHCRINESTCNNRVTTYNKSISY